MSEIHADTLDLLYARSLDEPSYQAQILENLDRKSAGFFSIGSVVLGLTAAASSINAWLLLVAVIAYGALAATAIHYLRPNVFFGRTLSDVAWPNHWDQPPDEVKHALVVRVSEDMAANRQLMQTKANAVRYSAAALSIETLVIALAIIASRL